MDSRKARREAEKVARAQLGSELVAVIGDLAVAVTERAGSAEQVEAARQQAAELVERARIEGRRLIDDATASVAQADESYAATYQAALDAGWTGRKLTDMGYPVPKRRRRKTTPPPAAQPEQAAGTGGIDVTDTVTAGGGAITGEAPVEELQSSAASHGE